MTKLLTLLAVLAAPALAAADPPRDGQHDFDFLNGRWKVQLRKLAKPLTGSKEWVEGTGTSTARPLFGGRGQLDELEVDLPSGHVAGVTMRLYSKEARQWSLYWVGQSTDRIDVPTVGEFKSGRGEFYDQELYQGRSILVRYVWSNITPTSAYFEQAFSTDGGKSWETNWTTQLTRLE